MGLPRPPEAFHRVYSPPEPPPQSHRPVVVRALTVVVLLVAGATGYMVYDRHDTAQEVAGRPAPPVIAARPSVPSSESRVTVPQLFTIAPKACVVVSPDTVRRLIPSATIAHNGGPTASTCDYSGKAGSRYRELRVETQIFAPAASQDPVDDAKIAIDSRLADARSDPVVRTVAVSRVGGLGDEAYQRYATDKGQPTVVGEVVVRVRNSVAAVSYAEDAPAGGGEEAVRQRCITEATAVVREILRAFE